MTEYAVAADVSVASDADPLTQVYFLKLFDALLPFDYVYPLKAAANSGYELLAADGAVGARVSTAVARLEDACLTLFAPYGARATGSVTFARPTAAAGAVTVKRGTVVGTAEGLRFVTDVDLVFGVGVLGPLAVTVTAEVVGYAYNVLGQRTTARGEVLPGEVDTIYSLATDPVYGDPTFTVAQPADFAGGVDDDLAVLAADRGVPTFAGEPELRLRYRVRALPDTVSPAAVQRIVADLLGDEHGCLREVGQGAFRGVFYDGGDTAASRDAYDVESFVLGGFNPPIPAFQADEQVELRDASGLVVATGYYGTTQGSPGAYRVVVPRTSLNFLAPGAVTGWRLVGKSSGVQWSVTFIIDERAGRANRRFRVALDFLEFRAFFMVGLPRMGVGEFGAAFDAGPMNAFDSAPDAAFFDGLPATSAKLYQSIWAALDQARAGGVGFDIYIEDVGCV